MEDLSRQPDIPVDLIGAGAATVVFQAKVAGDTQYRFTEKADGTLSWGPGSGASDLTFSRTGVGVGAFSGSITVSSLGIGQDVSGATKLGTVSSDTIASGASASWDAISFITGAATLTGATNITTASGFNFFNINAPTISAESALTITNAAAFTIKGAPVGGGAGPVTITNSYALWIQSGASRFDGATLVKQGSVSALGLAFQGGPTDGFYQRAATVIDVATNGVFQLEFGNNFITFGSTVGMRWLTTASPGGGQDCTLILDETGVLALKNSTTVQTLRVYGTTTGPQYTNLGHSGSAGFVGAMGGGNLLLQTGGATRVTIAGGSNTVTFAGVLVAAAGAVGAPSYTLSGSTTSGLYARTTNAPAMSVSGVIAASWEASAAFVWGRPIVLVDSGGSNAAKIDRDGTAIVAFKNSVEAQTVRIYGTTTGPKYLTLAHNGTNAVIDTSASSGNLTIGGNATSVTFSSVLLAADGTNIAPAYAFVNSVNSGMYLGATNSIYFSTNGTAGLRILGAGVGTVIASTGALVFSSSGVTANATDPALKFIAAGILAAVNVTDTNPTAFRVYGTSAGPKYLELKHDGTNGIVSAQAGDLKLSAAGNVRFGTHSALGAESVTGYITIKDDAGNSRKLAVVS